MYQWRWRYGAVAVLVTWVVVTYLVISPLRCGNEQSEDLQARLTDVSEQLERLKSQHGFVLAQIRGKGLSGIDLQDGGPVSGEGPPEEYETLRHRVYSQGREMWYFIESQLGAAIKEKSVDRLKGVLEQTRERSISWLSDMSRVPEVDGNFHWRRSEAANVSDLLQRRFHALQHPADCRAANKLLCNLNKGCGFGCQLHHLVFCFIYAYATERTLILSSKSWRYNPAGWERVFLPLSSCTSTYDDEVKQLPASPSDRVIAVPFVDALLKKPAFLPLAIPRDLAHRILRFNGDPASWWIGQIVKFLMKPREEFMRKLNDTIAQLGFKGPIVGVHVRRTDKVGTEAAFHHIKEYMKHVEEFYDQLELTRVVDKRRVYLASDDPAVLEDARSLYPRYEFLGDPTISKSAATHRRYSLMSLNGLLIDLHLLAACDYLVCTFSSQVGRTAYEMMQANRMDASDMVFSLDDIYYYGGQNKHERVAVLPHKARDEQQIDFEVGDKIGIAGNHWNGFGQGHNRRTNKIGLLPYFKTVDHLVLYPFPEYKHVPLNKASSNQDDQR